MVFDNFFIIDHFDIRKRSGVSTIFLVNGGHNAGKW